MYGARVAAELRRQGRDVVATQERVDLRGGTDREILAAATGERRAVVTENVGDFSRMFDLLARAGEHHAGIVLVSGRRFPRTSSRSAGFVRALGSLLGAHQGDDALRDTLVWL